MNTVLKWAALAAGAIVLVAVLASTYVYVLSEAIIQRRYPLQSSTVHAVATAKATARGKHLVAIAGCSGCHGTDLHGRLIGKDSALPVWSSNLKLLTKTMGDDEFERAIRFGIKPDATSTWRMPSYIYTYMSEDDVVAIVSYLRTLPPDGPSRPDPDFDLQARVALLEGKLAPVAPDTMERPAALDLGPRYDGGHYLARVSCAECHGTDLTGMAKVPDLTVVAIYDRPAFFGLLREGRAANGRTLKVMSGLARTNFHYFADYEITALYDYLDARAKALRPKSAFMTSRPLLRIKPREGRRVRMGAPWIFSNEIEMSNAAKALAPGSLVDVVGDDGRSFGTGYFNSKSLIGARLFECPADTSIDSAFLTTRLKRALALREAIYAEPYYRLVHAEGDGLPGLSIDRFGDAYVVQVTTAGMEALLEPTLAALYEVVSPALVILRADTPSRALEGLESYVRVVKGEAPSHIAVAENGARYFADPAGGQKTGWYYDQRDNRAFMASLAKGKSVLDSYCFSGGFAIAAARADASEVNALDSSAPALALAEEAAVANGVSRVCKFVKADVFEELERLAAAVETFGVVIADPPPFVKSRKDLEPGAKAYRKLARLSAGVTAPGGFLCLCSCSHNIPMERFANECAIGVMRTGRRATLIRQAEAGPDHPVHPMLPETAYLKALVFALD